MRILPLMAMFSLLSACGGSSPNGAVNLSVIGDRNAVVSPATAQGLVAFDADGQIEPSLAERWIVSDDGLSLVFRIARTNWANGKPVDADDVATSLKQSFAQAPHGRLGTLFTAVDDVVAMTDRVIEIRLKEPRPNMLQLLAQPEFGIRHNGMGTGPYILHKTVKGVSILEPAPPADDSGAAQSKEQRAAQEIDVRGDTAAYAIAEYAHGQSDVVMGGTFNDFSYVQAMNFHPSQMVVDPVRGLFGLAFMSDTAFTGDVTLRQALSMVIDRGALLQALNMPGVQPLETTLPAPLDSAAAPMTPDWFGVSMDQRRAEALRRINTYTMRHKSVPPVRVALPDGPGGRVLFARIAADWQAIGVQAVAVSPHAPADLKLIDEVAPNASVNWYFTRLSCAAGLPCDSLSDEALTKAREAKTLEARAQAYAQADSAYAANTAFIPLATPFRWSLTSSRLPGLRPSPFGLHPLIWLKRARG